MWNPLISPSLEKNTHIPNILPTWFRLNFDKAEQKACFKDFLERWLSMAQKTVNLIHY